MKYSTLSHYGFALLGLPLSNFLTVATLGIGSGMGQLLGNITYFMLVLSIFLIHYGWSGGLKNDK